MKKVYIQPEIDLFSASALNDFLDLSADNGAGDGMVEGETGDGQNPGDGFQDEWE